MGLCLSKQRSDLSNERDISREVSEHQVVSGHSEEKLGFEGFANSYVPEISGLRMSALNGIVEAFKDDNIYLIGAYGPVSEGNLFVEKASRIAMRDSLFDVIVMATVLKKPDLRRIQEEISQVLGLKFENKKDVGERCRCLCDKIKEHHRILIVLRDIWKRLDMGKVGIPFGEDHKGCKILLTSASEELLSNEMHTQKNFKV